LDELDIVIPLPDLVIDKEGLLEIMNDPQYGEWSLPTTSIDASTSVMTFPFDKLFSSFAGYYRKSHIDYKKLEPVKSIINQLNENIKVLLNSPEYSPVIFSKFPINLKIGKHKDSNRQGAIHIPLTDDAAPTLFWKDGKKLLEHKHNHASMMNTKAHTHSVENGDKERFACQISVYHPWSTLKEWYLDERLINRGL